MKSRPRAIVLMVITVLVASGCGSDTSPVPPVAEAPFICDGVPLRGFELALGGDVQTTGSSGRWGEGAAFICLLEGERTGAVEQDETASSREGVTGDEAWLRQLATYKQAAPIEADAPGAGYVYGIDTESVSAAWVCDGRQTRVTLDSDVKGRDGRQDAEALLVSMLPWACGEEEPPAASALTN